VQVCRPTDGARIHPCPHLQLPSVVSGGWIFTGHAACGKLGGFLKATADVQGERSFCISSTESVCDTQHSIVNLVCQQGMFLHIMCCIGASASLFICYTLLLVVRTHPWWQAQYFIPILGMLLGNAISGVSVGLSTVVDEFASGADSSYFSRHPPILTCQCILRIAWHTLPIARLNLCQQYYQPDRVSQAGTGWNCCFPLAQAGGRQHGKPFPKASG